MITKRTNRLAQVLAKSLDAYGGPHDTEGPAGGWFQRLGPQGQEMWAGEGGFASGILPVCPREKVICLAWRSPYVHMGNCWGTIGGAVHQGMSPSQSAIQELKEETGYGGPVKLIDAYVFSFGKFKYFNYLGVVQSKFHLIDHDHENTRIEWVDYEEALQEIEGGKAHVGLKALFEHSQDLIEKILHEEPTEETTEEENPLQ